MLLIFPHRPYSDCNEINITLLKINRMKKIKSFFLPYWLILSDFFFFSFCLSVCLSLSVSVCLWLSLSLSLSLSVCVNLSLSLYVSLSFSFCLCLCLFLFLSNFVSFFEKKTQGLKIFFQDSQILPLISGLLGPWNQEIELSMAVCL